MHHPDPGGDGVARSLDPQRLSVDQDLALVGLEQAVQHVHQGRLARAVLTEQGVNLSRLNRQVDVVVGDQVTEPFGDAAQFESQRNLLEYGRWCSLAASRADHQTIRPGRMGRGWYGSAVPAPKKVTRENGTAGLSYRCVA
ncbi:hypothetical protein GCM10027290_21120 [Micromonospora sonneratiae]